MTSSDIPPVVDPTTESPAPAGPSPSPDQLRAWRTRGRLLPLCGALAALLFCTLVPVCDSFCAGKLDPKIVLVLGVLLSAVATPCHFLAGAKSRTASLPRRALCYGLAIVLNTIGTSLCMTAYYVFVHTTPQTTVLVAGALASLLLYALIAALMQAWPHRYPLLTGIVALVAVVLMVISIVFWVRNDNKLFFSFVFFNLLWTLISVIALHVACTDEASPALRFASFASFGILIGVAAIVLVILACAGGDCDCDCSDGCCDCGDIRGSDTQTRKKKRRFFHKP